VLNLQHCGNVDPTSNFVVSASFVFAVYRHC